VRAVGESDVVLDLKRCRVRVEPEGKRLSDIGASVSQPRTEGVDAGGIHDPDVPRRRPSISLVDGYVYRCRHVLLTPPDVSSDRAMARSVEWGISPFSIGTVTRRPPFSISTW